MSNSDLDELGSVSDNNAYISLRDELTKRLDIRYQLVNYTLAAFAALMTVGISETGSALALLIYPLIATGLTLAWVDNHYRLKLIASYLRQRGSHWENTLENHRKNRSRDNKREWLGSLSIGVIFLGTQLIAAASGLYILVKEGSSDVILVIGLTFFACFAIVYTGYMLATSRKDVEIAIDNDERESQKTTSSASGSSK